MEKENLNKSHLPVVVIGAGLGGLGAACQLALSGEKVLLLEKHNVPGGFATSFVRGRFEFEGALHVLAEVGTEERPLSLYNFFKDLGVLNKIEFKKPTDLCRSVFYDGLDITFPNDRETYFEKLAEHFPNEKKGINKYKEIVFKVREGFNYVAAKEGKATPLGILLKHPYLARVGGLTLNDVFDRCFKDPKLRAVATQLWGYEGLPPSRVNAMYYFLVLMALLDDAVFPVGRSHALSSVIVECFEKMGGIVKYNALVNRILVKEGKVSGIELLNGEKYPCKAVISNLNPICTTMKMLPRETVSDQYKRRIYAPEIGTSVFTVYLGMNATPNDLGVTHFEVFMNSTYDLEEQYLSTLRIERPKYLLASCYNVMYKEISPPGTSQVVLTILQDGKSWCAVPPYQYHRKKDEVANYMIDMVEELLYPNLRDYIEIAEAATPLTYYHYSKSLNGAIYGYKQDLLDSPMMRMNSKGPIPGLYFAGAWVNLGGGYSTSITSGRMAAGMYLEEKEKGG
ncbi:MAG: phytoene desaturase family protein [Candidatus Thorarchaeota archaeon]